MQLKVIGSDSSGNSYLLIASNGDTLMIECGVHFNRIKRALLFNYRNVSAVVSHAHGDHAIAIKDVLNAGIPVFANEATLTTTKAIAHHRAKIIRAGATYTIQGFKVKPFDVNHDVPCLGFLIYHPEMGTTVFLTDTCYSDYVFPRLNNIIVECNHDLDIMEAKETPGFMRDRVIQSHMNIDTCKELLMANDLSMVNNIVLIHLSNTNSDATKFRNEITATTGKHVTIAEAGLLIDFNQQPI